MTGNVGDSRTFDLLLKRCLCKTLEVSNKDLTAKMIFFVCLVVFQAKKGWKSVE